MDHSIDDTTLTEEIKNLAERLGIDVLGFAGAEEFAGYIVKDSRRRAPGLSLPDARTIIVAGIYIGGLVLPSWDQPTMGRTSRLFLSGFFNDIIRQIEPIAALLQAQGYTALVCDDSKNDGSILPLKLAAIRAGFGWQGKNSLLVTRKFGTFLALGGILTNARLEFQALEHSAEEEPNRCKKCTKCQQACPLQALDQDYILNRDRCLSYLLQHDNFPEQAIAAVENRVMDCEICQQACPWNHKHIKQPLDTAMTGSFQPQIQAWEEFFEFSHLLELTEREYEEALGPLNTGVPYAIFRRNILMATLDPRDRVASQL